MSPDGESRRAVVLLSGGLDSATVLAIARAQGLSCYALTVDYGQRHHHEIEAARRIAQSLDVVEHRIFDLGLTQFGGSALTDQNIEVPDQSSDGIPVTYVPARNTVFLSLALAWAETLAARDIFIGANAVDYSGYPDCRPEFIEAFQQMANLATRAGVEGRPFTVHAPLVRLSKADIIRKGIELAVDYGLTLSCYDPDKEGRPCGHCDACRLRAKGFAEAGVNDPILAEGKLA